MQQQEDVASDEGDGEPSSNCSAQAARGCYGVQILIAGRQKRWRDCVSAQVRQAGFTATTVDSAVDALTVLVLGLPVDVLLTDVDLDGHLDCSKLAAEARALRPNLSIIVACDDETGVPDALVLRSGVETGGVASTVREALAARAA